MWPFHSFWYTCCNFGAVSWDMIIWNCNRTWRMIICTCWMQYSHKVQPLLDLNGKKGAICGTCVQWDLGGLTVWISWQWRPTIYCIKGQKGSFICLCSPLWHFTKSVPALRRPWPLWWAPDSSWEQLSWLWWGDDSLRHTLWDHISSLLNRKGNNKHVICSLYIKSER